MDLRMVNMASELLGCLGSLQAENFPATAQGITEFINRHAYGLIQSYDPASFSPLSAPQPPGKFFLVQLRTSPWILVIPLGQGRLWIIGPCVTELATDTYVLQIQRENRGLISNPEILTHQLRSFPLIPLGKLEELGSVLVRNLWPEHEPDCQVLHDAPGADAPEMIDEYASILPVRRAQDRYEQSRALSAAVSQGNLALASTLYQRLLPEIEQLKRSASPLRNAQTLCVIFNSSLRRAAEQAGVHPYELDSVSTMFGLRIEEARSVEDILSLSEEMMRRYCELVNDKRFPDAKPLVRQAISYASAHLSDQISAASAARDLGLNPDYFSHLFRAETGVTFTSFLNDLRVRQAKELLCETDITVQEISAAVGYNSASHFIASFRKSQGVTPLEYRRGCRV